LRASNVRLLVRTPGRRALVMAGRDWRSDRHRLHALPVSLRAVGSIEISERVVIQQFALEAVRTVNQVSTVTGLLGNQFAFGRLVERRLYARRSAVASERNSESSREHEQAPLTTE